MGPALDGERSPGEFIAECAVLKRTHAPQGPFMRRLIAGDPSEEGLGAFGLALEMQVPGRAVGAGVIYRALHDHYDLDERTFEFYAIHVEAEDEHGDNALKAVEWFAPLVSSRCACEGPFAGACSRTPRWPRATTGCSRGDPAGPRGQVCPLAAPQPSRRRLRGSRSFRCGAPFGDGDAHHACIHLDA
jgi:hypothetical protein